MAKRRELERQIATFRDISEIVEAMKNLALVEVRRINAFIDAQRRSVDIVEDALADFFDACPAHRAQPETSGDVWCVIGSERGFCGDFNLALAGEARSLIDRGERPAAIVLVGANLASAWDGPADAVCTGASVADEVPGVMAGLAERIGAAMRPRPGLAPRGLVLLMHDDGRPRLRRLLPLPATGREAPARDARIDLNLAPAAFLEAALRQFLFAAPLALLYESLLSENQRRLDHMDRALRKLDDRLAEFDRKRNRLRQEEITEEIELILLNAERPDGRRAPAPKKPANSLQEMR
ncbi:F0F1 ATP synthase subunit gamma [Burkholderiaceae bacterium FT117]|uniref:F0F1 ATP synthase subunit gamma n=1 Tax=Zeimonas sediminis TaxID=2944268 RepID=UPI002342D75B|nr:F0F1 ATP synthase subunit gamma [Zeimonas sediminis]MCM5569443.1 F0F1 ATP synthase subunit gamma [Zeimonas sediminis]